MIERLIVHGRYVDRTFIPDSPLPDAEGAAELIITSAAPQTQVSIVAAFGNGRQLAQRTGNPGPNSFGP